MEQRIGTDTPAVHAAGTDPAYIPGLTVSQAPDEADGEATAAPDEPEKSDATEPTATDGGSRDDGDSADETPEDDGAKDQDSERRESKDADPKDANSQDADPEDADPEDEAFEDKPLFTAFDLRGSLTATRSGVTLDMDGEEVDFSWEEIGAVQIETSRLRRRLTVTVHTTDHVRYEAEVKAPSRGDLATWEKKLDAVLDDYFDTDASSADTSGQDASEHDAS